MHELTANAIEGLCYWQGKKSSGLHRAKTPKSRVKVNGGSSLRVRDIRTRRGQLNFLNKNNGLINIKTTGFVV